MDFDGTRHAPSLPIDSRDDQEQRPPCRFHLRTVYMSGEVDVRKGEMDDFVRLVQENWGASADELNQLLREKRDER